MIRGFGLTNQNIMKSEDKQDVVEFYESEMMISGMVKGEELTESQILLIIGTASFALWRLRTKEKQVGCILQFKINDIMQKLTRDEMKNITCTEQGRSLKKKNLEMEYPFLLMKKGFTWMFDNFHWVLIGGCVVLAGLAWWGIFTGKLM